MSSNYNNARVQAVTYTGESATLTWELQHSLCANAGLATPGSDLSGDDISNWTRRNGMNKLCAYSASDNHVVADSCGDNWDFSYISGSLNGGVGYMCAYKVRNDCDYQMKVEGTMVSGNSSYPGTLTLNSGDAVFCSLG